MKVVIFVALCVAIAVAQMNPPPCGLDQARCQLFSDCMMTQPKQSPPPRPAAGVTPSAADKAARDAARDAAENYCFNLHNFSEAERTTVRNNRPQRPPRGPRPTGAPTGVATSG